MLKEALIGWNRHRAMAHAAAIAFYTILSVAPLLILTVSVAGRVYPQEAIELRIVAGVENQAGEPAATYVHDAIVDAGNLRHGRLATGFSVLILIWAGSAMFSHLQFSINEMWGISPKPERFRHSVRAIVRARLLSMALVVGMGYLVLVALTVNTIMAMIPVRWTSGMTDGIYQTVPFLRAWSSPVVYTILFGLTFKTLPQARIRWRDVWVGAALTAVLFWVGNKFIIYYLSNSVAMSVYGAASSVIVFLIWVYYSAWIVLFGAHFIRIYTERHGRTIVPYPYMTMRPIA